MRANEAFRLARRVDTIHYDGPRAGSRLEAPHFLRGDRTHRVLIASL